MQSIMKSTTMKIMPMRKRRIKSISPEFVPAPEPVPAPLTLSSFNDIELAETVLFTGKKAIVEGEKLILHLPADTVYSSLTVPTFDYILDLIEMHTGLSFFTKTHKSKLNVSVVSSDGFYDGLRLAIHADDLHFNKSDYLSTTHFGGMTFAHIAAHAIEDRNSRLGMFQRSDNMSAAIVEGFACFIDGLISKELGMAYGVVLDADMRKAADNIVYNDLAVFLQYSKDCNYGYQMSAHSLGYLFYTYIHEQFGMDGVIAVIIAAGNTLFPQTANFLSAMLNANILSAFPEWYERNADIYICDAKQSGTTLADVILLEGNKYDAVPFLSPNRYSNPRFYFDFRAASNGPTLIDFRNGFDVARSMRYLNFEIISFDIFIASETWVYLYNENDELIKTNSGKAGILSSTEKVAYVIIGGETKFHIIYYDAATPVRYQLPFFSTWLGQAEAV